MIVVLAVDGRRGTAISATGSDPGLTPVGPVSDPGPRPGQNSNDGAVIEDARAKDLLASARIAVFGGPGGIARLRSMRFTGTSTIPGEDGSMLAATVEIRVLLPDHYLRIDTGEFGRRQIGYAGRTTLDRLERPDGLAAPDPRDSATVLMSNRAALARLMFGVAMFTSPEMPVELRTHSTPREMPVIAESLWIDAVGSDVAAKIVLDARTRAPIRVAFFGPDRTVLNMAFSDRRSTGGMMAPYKIVTTAGDRIVDELRFDEVTVNPSLRKADFIR
jgi:hypothetical protein